MIALSDEVRDARAAGMPVVALESTIITHGMAWPGNYDTARTVEAEVRGGGAVPATVAVTNGVLRVGLPDDDLRALAQRGTEARKLSRADLAFALATGATGGTTVAATMIAARLAGIEVFATGGIGGVHRGAEATWDVSADLQELARTSVTVVCAGPKAILDLPRTLEVLETLGVPVVAYGQDALPAFWSRDAGLPAPLRADDAGTIARAHRARAALGLPGGHLVCHPIPAADEIPAVDLAPVIERAVAETAHMAAKDVTPALLGRIVAATDGASLRANVALIRANARLGAEIAVALAEMPR